MVPEEAMLVGAYAMSDRAASELIGTAEGADIPAWYRSAWRVGWCFKPEVQTPIFSVDSLSLPEHWRQSLAHLGVRPWAAM